MRDTLAAEVARMREGVEFVIIEGDVVGDDLGLFPRLKRVMSVSNSPLYLVPGNHDLDLDAAAAGLQPHGCTTGKALRCLKRWVAGTAPYRSGRCCRG